MACPSLLSADDADCCFVSRSGYAIRAQQLLTAGIGCSEFVVHSVGSRGYAAGCVVSRKSCVVATRDSGDVLGHCCVSQVFGKTNEKDLKIVKEGCMASTPDTSRIADSRLRRSALVTGASRGIGFQIARRLADEGYDLTVSARRRDGLLEAADKLRTAAGVDVHPVVANLAKEADVAELVSTHAGHFDGLDLLVLNAGVGADGRVAELSTKRYDLVLNVNLRSQFLLIQHAVPLLKKAAAAHPKNGARIVALASITGVAAEPGLSAYGASKAALISLCEAFSLEESENGVSATAISPGYVATDMTSDLPQPVDEASMLEASDIAELVVALSRLSAKAVVPNIVVSRAGSEMWRA